MQNVNNTTCSQHYIRCIAWEAHKHLILIFPLRDLALKRPLLEFDSLRLEIKSTRRRSVLQGYHILVTPHACSFGFRYIARLRLFHVCSGLYITLPALLRSVTSGGCEACQWIMKLAQHKEGELGHCLVQTYVLRLARFFPSSFAQSSPR